MTVGIRRDQAIALDNHPLPGVAGAIVTEPRHLTPAVA